MNIRYKERLILDWKINSRVVLISGGHNTTKTT